MLGQQKEGKREEGGGRGREGRKNKKRREEEGENEKEGEEGHSLLLPLCLDKLIINFG